YYRHCPPDPRRGSYGSDSWALLNMIDYARWSHNTDAEAALCRLVEAHFLAIQGGCGYCLETGRFMAVTTNWAWLVSQVLPADAFRPWAQAFFAAAGGLPQPVARPANWHHHGLNFSRAWGLAALAAASTSEAARHAYLAAYASHVRATYDMPSLWRDSYRCIGHWVPQFGLLAIQPLFDPQWGCRGAGNSVLSTALRSPERPSGGA
ncbi:MAG TPA: DUF2891 family protein, partial [Hyphomicrobiaceae bacterium]|nr:DUF2891 family protein [Hyphomicrobiaceae bacterium]